MVMGVQSRKDEIYQEEERSLPTSEQGIKTSPQNLTVEETQSNQSLEEAGEEHWITVSPSKIGRQQEVTNLENILTPSRYSV